MKKIRYSILFFLAVLPFGSVCAAGGELYVSPASGVYRVGEPFEITVLANTGGQAVNAVEAELAYNPGDVAVDRISIDKSILTSWSTTPAYDGASGVIKFSGWVDHNYSGKDGILITITLRPLRVAQSTVLFNSGAMLAADGRGSNIITSMTSGSYALSPQQIIPPAPPPEASSSAPQEAAATQEQSGALGAPPPPAAATDQAAAAIIPGADLAVIFIPFFVILMFIAFCIAYMLHRKGIR